MMTIPQNLNVPLHPGLSGLLQTLHLQLQAVPAKLECDRVQILFPAAAPAAEADPLAGPVLASTLLTASLHVSGYLAAGAGKQITLESLTTDFFAEVLPDQELVAEGEVFHQTAHLIRCQCHLYGEKNRLLARGTGIFSVGAEASF